MESKLALALEKSHEITSELEASRSQLHAKEREFDEAKAQLERVKQELQASQDALASSNKQLDERKSLVARQEVRQELQSAS